VYTLTETQQTVAEAAVGKKAVPLKKAINTDTQQQYHMAQIPAYHYLPLTAAQATKVNAALAYRIDPSSLLSPRQLDILKEFQAVKIEQFNAIKALKVDRSVTGLPKYWENLRTALATPTK
jgi:hypothetical protein